MASLKTSKSSTWESFELIEVDGKKKTKCKLCSTKLAYNGNTSAMQNHLKAKHQLQLSAPSSTTTVASSSGQLRLSGMFGKKPMTQDRWLKITKKCVEMCARDLRPLNIVEGVGFRALLQELDPTYRVPCHTTIGNHLHAVYQGAAQELRSQLKGQAVALTTDLWTSPANKGIITVTGHFIDATWTLNQQVLATRHMEDRHTGVNIAKAIREICSDFNIPMSSVAGIVHDNASNMEVAMRELGVPHLGCFGHTLQLAIKDGLESGNLQKHIAHCRKLVGHFKHSALATEELHKRQEQMGMKKLNLIQDVETRWGSTYQMMERLQANRLPIYAVLHDKDVTKDAVGKRLDLTDATWTIIETLPRVLKPLHVATEQMGGVLYPTLALIYPVLLGLTEVHLKEPEDDAIPRSVVDFMTNVKNAIKRRFEMTDGDCDAGGKLLLKAALLYPRYKELKFLEAEVKTQVKAEVQRYMGDADSASTGTPGGSATDSCQEPPRKMAKAESESQLAYLLGDLYDDFEETFAPPDEELEKYLAEPAQQQEPLIWWRDNSTRFPNLARVAKSILCIPATSIPSERLFSVAGLLMTKNRASLDPETLDELLFVNAHMKAQERQPKPTALTFIKQEVKTEVTEPESQESEATTVPLPPLPVLPVADAL